MSEFLHMLNSCILYKYYNITLYLEKDQTFTCRAGHWKGCSFQVSVKWWTEDYWESNLSPNSGCAWEWLTAHSVNWGTWERLEVCACVRFVYSYTGQNHLFSPQVSCRLSECKIHIMLKLFPKISMHFEWNSHFSNKR